MTKNHITQPDIDIDLLLRILANASAKSVRIRKNVDLDFALLVDD